MESTPPGGKMSGNGSDNTSRAQTQQQANLGANGNANGDAREKLMSDMKAIIGEAESWLQNSAAGDALEAGAVQQQFQDTLQTTKTDLLRLESNLLAKTKLAAQATDAYVQDHPWKAVTMGAAIGMLFGLFISRK